MRSSAPVLFLAMLAACGGGDEPAPVPERDPASEQALADQILADPDLANQNEGNAALTVSSDHSLPLLVSTPESIAAARAEAALLVGRSDQLGPPPAEALDAVVVNALSTPAQFAASLPGGAECAPLMTYSAAWAATLPEALSVYPGGATLEAAGVQTGSCNFRLASFVTPVAADDLLSFYAVRARDAKFPVTHLANGTDHVLAGRKAGAAFRLAVRIRDDRLTEATLAVAGD